MLRISYKITLGKQLILLFPLLLTNSLALFISIYLFDWTIATLAVITFLLICSFIPTILVHVQYLIKNKGLKVTIDREKEILFYNNKTEIISISFSDVSELINVTSYGRGTNYYTFSEYQFSKIIFKDNTELVITSLLMNELDKLPELIDQKGEKKYKLLALV